MVNKSFKYYAAIWAILFVLFNSVLFIVTENTIGIANVEASFWFSYCIIIISFVAQILCAKSAFSGDSQKLFYGLPLIQVSFSGLIASIFFGVVIMIVPAIPCWIGAVICLIVSAIEAIAVVKAKAASDIISNRDAEIKQNTAFIREMTAEAELLFRNAKTEEEKRELKKLYEAFRYSDPVSCSSASDVEQEIRHKVSILKDDFSISLVLQIMPLISLRNSMCKDSK